MYLRLHDGNDVVQVSVKIDSDTSELQLRQIANALMEYDRAWFDDESKNKPFDVCGVSLLIEKGEKVTFSTKKFSRRKKGKIFYIQC